MRDRIVIGNQNQFALEYRIETEEEILMAYNCLWIQGKFLGNYEDTGALYGVYRRLNILVSKNGNFYEPEFLNKTPEEVMLTMIPNFYEIEKKFQDFSEEEQKRLIKYDKYLYGFGENYDNFIIRIYAINGEYHFIWQLRPQEWQESEVKCYQGYDRSIQHGIVSLQDLKNVLSELENKFPEWKA